MKRNRMPSPQAVAVLQQLAAAAPGAWHHGYELCRNTDLKAGTMYPILMRLADRGQLETKWEPDPPAGRPPRHLYRLTAAGRRTAAELTAEQAGTSRPRARLRIREEQA